MDRQMTPQEQAEILTGARIATVMPEVREEVGRQLQGVINKALSAIQRGELTPDKAMQFWLEYSATRGLLTRFEQRVNITESAAEIHRTQLELTPNGEA